MPFSSYCRYSASTSGRYWRAPALPAWRSASARRRWSAVLASGRRVPGIDRVTGNEVEYLMLVKTRPGAQYAVTRELRRRIKDVFDKNNIQPGGAGRMYVVDSGPQKPPA